VILQGGTPVATACNITYVAGVVALQFATVGEPTQTDPWIVKASPPQSFGCNQCDVSALYMAKYGLPPARCKIWVSITATDAGWRDLPSTLMLPVLPAA
jgi:hypothetical protein